MIFKLILIFKIVISICLGQVVFPDDNSLIKKLGVSRITTRFNFPSTSNGCTIAGGESGKCIPLRECPELTDYIRRNNGIRTNENINFLRSRICRFQSNSINLCCKTSARIISATPPTRSGTPPPTSSGNILPSMDECGFTTAARITSGTVIKHGSQPWLVALGFPQTSGSFRSLCGGTLITKRHVLTAAHCFQRVPGIRPISHASLGQHSLQLNDERNVPDTIRIKDRKSPGYNTVSHVNDLELLELEKDVSFNSYIRPACLPFNLDSIDFEKVEMLIAGWGDTSFRSNTGSDTPMAANVTGVSKTVCKEAYASEPQVPLDRTQFCAGQGPKDACQGDSGGPLLFNDLQTHSRVFLVGVISFGVGCANPDFPGVYTFVPEFLDWIQNNL